MRTLSKREEDILVFAMRYAMQRATAAPAIVADEIRAQMHRITPETREQMSREITETICRKSFHATDADVGMWTTLQVELRASLERD